MAVFKPAVLNFDASAVPAMERGMTFLATLVLETLEGGKKPLDLSGYTVEVFIEGIGFLKAGSGLTVTNAEGKIVMECTPEQTEGPAPGTNVNWYVSLAKAGQKSPPVKGTISVVNP